MMKSRKFLVSQCRSVEKIVFNVRKSKFDGQQFNIKIKSTKTNQHVQWLCWTKVRHRYTCRSAKGGEVHIKTVNEKLTNDFIKGKKNVSFQDELSPTCIQKREGKNVKKRHNKSCSQAPRAESSDRTIERNAQFLSEKTFWKAMLGVRKRTESFRWEAIWTCASLVACAGAIKSECVGDADLIWNWAKTSQSSRWRRMIDQSFHQSERKS